MVTDVISVSPRTPISEVADLLFNNRFHGVPVVEKGKVAGIITEDDFFLKNYDEMYLPSYLRFLKENKSVDNLPDDIKDKIEDFKGALEDYNIAIELKPNYSDAYHNRGIVKLELGDKNGACLDWSKAGELGQSKSYEMIKKYCGK